jgi:ABC-type transport system involved in multi-copper enzyme maturation permease subunit
VNADATIRRALLLDAVYQVLDNRVFRILVVLIALLIGLTFFFGFREDEVVLLFGWRRYDYEQFLEAFPVIRAVAGLQGALGVDMRVALIRSLQRVFVDVVAGYGGIAMSIAATAFFVPRLLEKGLADGLFSKPISRAKFLLACYCTGLLFVVILATTLVVGMHLGLLLVSGYSDTSFLWSILTLCYVFALVHAVTMLMGVLTRNSVASLLLGVVFFFGNACVHRIWSVKEYAVQFQTTVEEQVERRDDDGPSQEVVDGLVVALDALHYALPKTNDAGFLADRVRAKVSRNEPDFFDAPSQLRIQRAPDGWSVAAEDFASAPTVLGQVASNVQRVAVARFEGAADGFEAWLEVAPAPRGGRLLSERLAEKLKSKPGVGSVRRDSDRRRWRSTYVEWIEALDGDPYTTHAVLTRLDERVAVVVVRAPSDWVPPFAGTASPVDAPTPRDGDSNDDAAPKKPPESPAMAGQRDLALALADSITSDSEVDPFTGTEIQPDIALHAKRFGWTSPLPYNAWFSIASSVAFTALVLLLAAWRLRRIDF